MAHVGERSESSYWDAYWYDALRKPHHKSTKVRVLPKGKFTLAERNSLKAESKRKALDIANEWERADKGDADIAQSQKALAQIQSRKSPSRNRKSAPSTKNFLIDYLESIINRIQGSTAKLYLGFMMSFLVFLGPRSDLPVYTLISDDFEGYKAFETSEEGKSGSTVIGAWRFLRSAFKSAVGKYLPSNPMANVRPPMGRPSSPRRPLEPKEVPKLLAAALRYLNGWQWVTIILFSVYAGLRLSDAIRVRWSMINLDEGYIDFTQFKLRHLRKEMRTPLHDELLRWLLYIKRYAKCDEIVYTLAHRSTTSLSISFQRILGRAGIDSGAEERLSGLTTHKVVFHSIRHTIVSWLDDLGVPETHREELVGHACTKSHATNKRYSHTRLKGLRRTVAKLPSVAAGVIPLAKVVKALPTSAGLLSDDIREKLATLRQMAKDRRTDRTNFCRELEQLQILIQRELSNSDLSQIHEKAKY